MAYSKCCNDLAIRLSQLLAAEKAIALLIPTGAEYGHLLASIKAERNDINRQLVAAAQADLNEDGEDWVNLFRTPGATIRFDDVVTTAHKPEEGKDETDYSSYIDPDRSPRRTKS